MGLDKNSLTAPRPTVGPTGPHGAPAPMEHRSKRPTAEDERRLDAAIAALNAFDATHGAFADEHTAF